MFNQRIIVKNNTRDFPGGPVVKTELSLRSAGV